LERDEAVTERVIIAGFGGQGVMTMGKLLVATAMREGREVTYFPCYGAEVRGGTAYCHIVISDEPIYSPSVEEASALFLFNQLSYDKFRKQLGDGGLLVLNSSLAETDPALERIARGRCLRIPATEAANEIGSVLVTNVIMLGAYCAARKVVSSAAVLDEMEQMGKGKTHLLDINRRAFHKGEELAETAKRT
jgi:2-oxoglutarate ferredoxin oxidoreductase subunit gamma